MKFSIKLRTLYRISGATSSCAIALLLYSAYANYIVGRYNYTAFMLVVTVITVVMVTIQMRRYGDICMDTLQHKGYLRCVDADGKGAWYHKVCEECAEEAGPFITRKAAYKALMKYVRSL